MLKKGKYSVLWIDVLVVALIGFGAGFAGYEWWRNRQSEVRVEYIKASEERSAKVMVDVSGAVVSPGVYELLDGARVKDAIVAAGGLSAEADRDFVGKVVNMADKVKDAQKIYIAPKSSLATNAMVGKVGEQLISVNSATKEQLMGLSGIGEVRSQAIIDGRPYASIDELVTRKVLTKSLLENNRERLSI